MSLSQFAEFLSQQPPPIFTDTPLAEPCVYYLCSSENFQKIYQSGAILPKNAVINDEEGDLSSATIQTRRTGSLQLGNGQKNFPIIGHNCLNFFLNPNNTTFQAFVRNSMVDNRGVNEVLILSIPLSRLIEHLDNKNQLFSCSNMNIAKRYSSISSILDDYKTFNWCNIMAPKGHTAERSAELLLWFNDHKSISVPSAGIPLELIDTVYSPDDYEYEQTCNLAARKCEYNHTLPTVYLFTNAQRFNQYLVTRTPIDYQELMKHFVDTTKQMPFPLCHKSFTNKELSTHYQHGYLHVLKVMLWVAFLTHPKVLPLVLPNQALGEDIAIDAMFTALIHDLARKNNTEDTVHGQNSIRKFSDDLLMVSNEDMTRLKKIRMAISEHCKPDSESKNPSNALWAILKDADALDRGRFGDPCEADSLDNKNCGVSQCSHSGCVHRSLRLDYSKLGGTKAIADAARSLANLVYSAPISPKSPIDSFRVYVQVSIDRVNYS